MTNLGLYIHMPWCVQKCPYCDFNSHALKEILPENQYLNALIKDLEQDLPDVEDRTVTSLFIGGGTPSLFSPASIAHLLTQIQQRIELAEGCEITMEANPGSLEHGLFAEYAAAGVTRISLGVQSFNAQHLKTLGRIHGPEEALSAIEAIQNAGFNSFNIDLMHTLPNQTVDEALSDLETAISLSPPHLSWYELTLEPNTLFYAKPPRLPEEGVQSEIEEEGLAQLKAHFEHYEVSAYSTPGLQCQHNLNYWTFGDYLGIGAGAHAKITTPKGVTRTSKFKHPKLYLSTEKFVQTQRVLSEKDLILESMLGGLRLINGYTLEDFEHNTGLRREVLAPYLQHAKAKGLIEDNDHILVPSTLGRRYLNDLVNLFE